MLNKIKNTPLYNKVYEVYQSIDILINAGFFNDKLNYDNIDYNFLATPYGKILKNYNKDETKKNIILYITGAFSPIHEGHIEILNKAREVLINEYNVLGAYIAPGHDNYVSTKHEGKSNIGLSKRLFLCDKMVADSDWIMVDKFPALFLNNEANFSFLLERIQTYIKMNLSIEVEVAYVYGSDNIGFSRAFLEKFIGVCVVREQENYHNNKKKLLDEEPIKKIITDKRLFFVDQNPKGELSSTNIRKESTFDFKINEGMIVVRDDSEYAIKNYLSKDSIDYAKTSMVNILKKYFSQDVVFSSLVEQEKIFNEVEEKRKIVNLDNCLSSNYINLHITRMFDLSDGQIFSKELVSRVGYPSFEQQIKNIVNKEDYVLVDDDIVSGSTVKKAIEIMSYEPKEILSLTEYTLNIQNHNKEIFDFLDLRDFVFGSKDSGLTIGLPNGEKARAPYVLPYVSPLSRIRLIAAENDNAYMFSKDVFTMNLLIFLKNDKKLSETDVGFQKLMKHIGFKDNDLLSTICKWHLKFFTN